jgi:aldehyde dehydrogenase (NAD+)
VAFAEDDVAAGWPAEALAVLPVGNEATMQLVRDPRLPVISFTGGPVGWTFRDAAPRKHVHLEMGGVGATLVAADADLDEAVEQCMVGGFVRSGQACLSVQRIFVERPVYDEVVTRLADRVATLAAGDPTDPGTQVGPLVDEAAAERVTRLVDDAAGRGARVCCGGTREGALVTPTFLADVPDGAQLLRTEAFGPVMVAVCVDRLEDAVDEANAVGGALQVGVFTRDLDRALGLADLLDAGSVIVNGSNAWRIDTMPFGGTGVAGSGREGVRWMVEELTQTKVVVLRRTG